MRTGIADLPLHYGTAPRWLFERMRRLAKEIAIVIVDEFGRDEFLRKISDPYWFQALGALLGFDWHSSGVTTTVCGAMKEGIKDIENELGIFIAGGKGKASRRTPEEISEKAQLVGAQYIEPLQYASRMSAKVDSAGLQDGYQIYAHTFFFTSDGKWAVVQQGMNPDTRYARRYHWLTLEPRESFVSDPHNAISATRIEKYVLNTVAKGHDSNRSIATELAKESPDKTLIEFKKLQTLNLPNRHHILLSDINPDRLYLILTKTYAAQPDNFEKLLGLKGVGPKTIRALTLTTELIYGEKVSFTDPARFSYAHGGKNGHPYPVDRKTYDRTIWALERAIKRTKIGEREKFAIFKQLNKISRRPSGY